MNQVNYTKMPQLPTQVDWSFINAFDIVIFDIDDAYLSFHETITFVIDVVSPEISVKINANILIREPWYTKGLMKSSKTLSKLYSHHNTNPVLIIRNTEIFITL